MRRVLDYDPETGTTTYHEYDHGTRETTIIEVQDAAPYLARNRELANDESRKRKGIKDGMWHFATIPNGVISQWLKEGFDVFNRNQRNELKRRLNSPEWQYLRTTSGRM